MENETALSSKRLLKQLPNLVILNLPSQGTVNYGLQPKSSPFLYALKLKVVLHFGRVIKQRKIFQSDLCGLMQEPQETSVLSLGWKNPLEEGMATHSSILAENPMDKGAWQATVHRGCKE